MIFYLAGINPPKVTKSKLREDSELIRLSFRDIMWYCYLNQDEIDSSFFNLGKDDDNCKRLKSRDVMRYILGFYQENVSQLERELVSVQQEGRTLLESSKQLRKFLDEQGISGSQEMIKEIENLDLQYRNANLELENLKFTISSEVPDTLDKLKQKSLSLYHILVDIQQTLDGVTFRIDGQSKLMKEFLIAGAKSTRAQLASEVLRQVHFETCPECGNSVRERKVSINQCPLCTQDFRPISMEKPKIDVDLMNSKKELEESIQRLTEQKKLLIIDLEMIMKEKSLVDAELQQAERDLDSRFLALYRSLDVKRGELLGRLEELKRLTALPEKVKELEARYFELAGNEESLKNELKQTRVVAEKDRGNLKELRNLFMDNLRVGMPGVKETDVFSIATSDFIPKLSEESES